MPAALRVVRNVSGCALSWWPLASNDMMRVSGHCIFKPRSSAHRDDVPTCVRPRHACVLDAARFGSSLRACTATTTRDPTGRMEWHGVASLAWRGMAWSGLAWHGMEWHGVAWHSMAWHGVAWLGVAWHGVAWHP